MTGKQQRHIFQSSETHSARGRTVRFAIAVILLPACAIIAANIDIADPARPGNLPEQTVGPRDEAVLRDPKNTTNEAATLTSPATNAAPGIVTPAMRLKTPEDAERVARELQFKPADAVAWRMLGEYHFRRSEYGEAATNFGKGLNLVPDDPLSINNLAASLVMLGRIDEAKKILDSALSRNPRNYSMRFNLACIAARQNRKSDAMRLLQELEQLRWPLLQLHLADPDLDILRADAPFIAMQNRVQKRPIVVHLPEPEQVDIRATQPDGNEPR